MTEHTDKASRKSSKALPKKRPAKSRTPKGKRAKAPGRLAETPLEPQQEAAGAKSLSGAGAQPETKPKTQTETKPAAASAAPDPATIVFGSNRPIVAQPQKLPESSGLRFSGPSAGELKSSGPQPNSPKASGLTFQNAKNGTSGNGGKPGEAAKPGNGAKPLTTKAPEENKPAPGQDTPSKDKAGKDTKAKDAKSKDGKESAAKSAEKSGAEAKKDAKAKDGKGKDAKAAQRPVFTKPAIAPQASGRRLEKERSSRGFVTTLFGLAVVVGGLAYWLNPASESAAPGAAPTSNVAGDVATLQPAPEFAPAPQAAPPAAPEAPAPIAETPEPPLLGPSPRAPVSPGPLAATASPATTPELSIEEIAEIQLLLQRLDLAPGNTDGVLTADTAAAIRSYQEMAGLGGDGEANRALLEELRSVVELYGG